MKVVIAFVQPFMAAKVVQALHEVRGLSGATFTEVRGFGRGRTKDEARPTEAEVEEELLGTLAKVRVEAMVPDTLADLVVQTIRDAAHTGNRGDGKVYVSSIDHAVRISTGEEGEQAV